MTFQPQNKTELQIAVDKWIEDEVTALSVYGEINTWDTSLVTDMSRLFESKVTFNDNINGWDTSNVTDMARMFHKAENFNQNLSNFNFESLNPVDSMLNMLKYSGIDVSNYNVILNNWSDKTVPNVVLFTANNLKYSLLGVPGRSNLINNYNWVFTGDIFQPQDKTELQTAVDKWIEDKTTASVDYGQINTWDTSLVTDMSNLFENKATFNDEISSWDTSNVENMSYMFSKAENFNQPLNDWNTSNVTDMRHMFNGYSENGVIIYSSFNKSLNNWDVSNVKNMSNMFMMSIFNQNIDNWDVSNVQFMNWMFHHSSITLLSFRDVSNVIEMGGMFHSAKKFNGDISGWNTTNVTSMNGLFANTNEFNQNISGWNTSNVIYMSGVFDSADKFNQNISSWDTSKVIDMTSMFKNTDSFNQELITTENGWNTSNVKIMSNMFNNAKMFNQSLDTWDTSNVTDMSYMFNTAENFNQNLSNFNFESLNPVDSMTNMLNYSGIDVSNYNDILYYWSNKTVPNDVLFTANNLKYSLLGAAGRSNLINNYNWDITGDIFQPQDKKELKTAVDKWIEDKTTASVDYGQINTWDTSLVTDMSNLFENKATFNDEISSWDTSNVENMSYMFSKAENFNQPLNDWNTSNVTDMRHMFNGYSENGVIIYSSFNKSLNNWDVSNVKNMSNMFMMSIFNQNIDNWDVSNVQFMNWMFHHSSITLLSFRDVSNVIEMGGMFHSAKKFNGDISGWNTTNVTSMNGLFANTNEFNQNISGWNTSNVIYMSGVFDSADKFNQNISSWDTSKVIDMTSMFKNTDSFNQELITTENGWNTSNVKIMSNMFNNAKMFNQSLDTWDISNINNNVDITTQETEPTMEGMLDNSDLSVENYDATLNGWASQTVQPNVILGAQGLEYSSSGEIARNFLINTYNWDIQGDILICFMKDTMILILENGIELERKVQELKNGDIVKISTGEYKKLVFIGTKTIDITKNMDKIRIMKKNKLGDNLPNKDLLVTSGHSVLFKNLKNINKYYNKKVYNNNVKGYYKMMSQHCKLFDYVKENELKNIRDGNNVSYYHFVLENDNETGQYGVYSNGILSETMALQFGKKNFN